MATVNNYSSKNIESCCICLDDYRYPVEIPCGHIFCFLCIKGRGFHQNQCPLCRKIFTLDLFQNPKVITANQVCQSSTSIPANKLAWFYKGEKGWWEYEERAAKEIEEHFSRNAEDLEIQIAGYVYIIDFKNMTQARKNETGRQRLIKRDLANSDKVGVAGIISCQTEDDISSSSSAT